MFSRFALAGFLLLPGVAGAVTIEYRFTPILVPGSDFSSALAINNAGRIVGGYGVAGQDASSFLKDGSIYRSIHVPGYRYGVATGINNNDVVVGQAYNDPQDRFVGYRYDSRAEHLQILDASVAFGDGYTTAHGINDHGQIVGNWWNPSTGSARNWIYDGVAFQDLAIPIPQNQTSAQSINNAGQIVGRYFDGGCFHGFSYLAGILTVLDNPLGYCHTSAIGVNNLGDIVGWLGWGHRLRLVF